PRNPDAPRIYVASLADYSAGILHGRWIELDQSAEEIRAEISGVLATSTQPLAEEWAIHDYENFAGLRLSEGEDIDTLVELVERMEEHGPVFAKLVDYRGGTSSLKEATDYMEENYRGAFDSLADYAQELIEDCYSDVLAKLPDFIRGHIDYAGIG